MRNKDRKPHKKTTDDASSGDEDKPRAFRGGRGGFFRGGDRGGEGEGFGRRGGDRDGEGFGRRGGDRDGEGFGRRGGDGEGFVRRGGDRGGEGEGFNRRGGDRGSERFLSGGVGIQRRAEGDSEQIRGARVQRGENRERGGFRNE